MARTIYKCRLAKITSLTKTLRELQIEVLEPKGFKYQAGQFVMLQVPDNDTGKPAMRAYSIASNHNVGDKVTLLIKLLEQGKSSDFIRELKGGESFDLTGPFGKLFFKQPPAEQILMLCTGAGLSQHMSFLTSHADILNNTKIHLFLGVWNETEVFYKKELDEVKKRLPQFNYEYVVDASATTWSGKKGYVTDFLKDFDYKKTDTHIYLCGNPNMIKNAKGILEQNAFDPTRILAEAFG